MNVRLLSRWARRGAGAAAVTFLVASADPAAPPSIEIWHGDRQSVGRHGDQQDDFNLVGHVARWRELDRLTWKLDRQEVPLSFRAWRRLVRDGDFNADIPIGQMKAGANTVTITAYFRDGSSERRAVTVDRQSGASPLPARIRWRQLRHPQEAGQIVDGQWEISPEGLRTRQTGYDRLFLIGERGWRDYAVSTTLKVHALDRETTPLSGGPGAGVILRFAGHVTGGPRWFASGQPKWGYQPFGSIGWLRWVKEQPRKQYYPGDSDRSLDHGAFDFTAGEPYRLRLECRTLPDEDGRGVTVYRFKVWPARAAEPAAWDWEQRQASATALRRGGVALVAHHADVTFGDIDIDPI